MTTLYINKCIFRDCLQVNIRSCLRSLIVPMTWSMNMYSSKESKEVRKGISLRMSNVDRRSTVPKFDDLTKLKFGNSAVFPDWSLKKIRMLEILIIMFSDFLVNVLVKINLLHY